MSSMRNPVGPEEPSVYWRRRAIVGVSLLVALLVLWWLFSAVFGSEDPSEPQTPAPTTSSSPTGSPQPTASPSPSAKAAAPPSISATAPATSAAAGKPATGKAGAAKQPPRCSDANVSVVVKPAERTGDVGAGMKLTLTVTNAGDTTCRRQVAEGSNEIRVVSGRVLVWSSNYCEGVQDGDSGKAAVVTLKPDASWSTTVTWPGKVTASTCPAQQPIAKAGTYRAVGSNGAKGSPESVFTLG